MGIKLLIMFHVINYVHAHCIYTQFDWLLECYIGTCLSTSLLNFRTSSTEHWQRLSCYHQLWNIAAAFEQPEYGGDTGEQRCHLLVLLLPHQHRSCTRQWRWPACLRWGDIQTQLLQRVGIIMKLIACWFTGNSSHGTTSGNWCILNVQYGRNLTGMIIAHFLNMWARYICTNISFNITIIGSCSIISIVVTIGYSILLDRFKWWWSYLKGK